MTTHMKINLGTCNRQYGSCKNVIPTFQLQQRLRNKELLFFKKNCDLKNVWYIYDTFYILQYKHWSFPIQVYSSHPHQVEED